MSRTQARKFKTHISVNFFPLMLNPGLRAQYVQGTSTLNTVGRVIGEQLVSKFSHQCKRKKVEQELHRGLSEVYPANTAELFSHSTTSLHQAEMITTAGPQYLSAKPKVGFTTIYTATKVPQHPKLTSILTTPIIPNSNSLTQVQFRKVSLEKH